MSSSGLTSTRRWPGKTPSGVRRFVAAYIRAPSRGGLTANSATAPIRCSTFVRRSPPPQPFLANGQGGKGWAGRVGSSGEGTDSSPCPLAFWHVARLRQRKRLAPRYLRRKSNVPRGGGIWHVG